MQFVIGSGAKNLLHALGDPSLTFRMTEHNKTRHHRMGFPQEMGTQHDRMIAVLHFDTPPVPLSSVMER